jgi:hypothetical protein
MNLAFGRLSLCNLLKGCSFYCKCVSAKGEEGRETCTGKFKEFRWDPFVFEESLKQGGLGSLARAVEALYYDQRCSCHPESY